MEIIKEPAKMQQFCLKWQKQGVSVGFVPTMGALHAGHMELCRQARSENDKFVASIFVNPTQFGPNEDLAKYPRPFERDAELLAQSGCDAIFCPGPQEMYGSADLQHGTWVDVTPFDELWEGVTRPGHLRGVATVVAKLFNIVRPTRAYFGEKDYQQLKVVEHLVRDLNFGLDIVPVPTLREADGLALSSRNVYLSTEEREAATSLSRALKKGGELVAAGERDVAILGRAMEQILTASPLVRVQYVAVVDPETLAPLTRLTDTEARVLIAAYVGKTRLIDNGPLKPQ